MKNSLILCLCAFVLVFWSCTENEMQNEPEFVNQTKIEQVLNAKNKSEQKLTYTLLNKDEKYNLWINKLKTVLSQGKLNKNQRLLINKFIAFLKPKHFITDSDEQLFLKNVYIPKYLGELKKEFTVNQIGTTFYKIPITHVDNEGGGGETKDCDCNRNSMVSCQWLNTSSCEERTCKSSYDGCGFLLAYSCNGICRKPL
ncbi:bacteriocin fulvocin C-related protein [Tenacibaculum tangerinum]|uniref:Bacteriocin fulvocin C-related protein n=1 Tax=Tenacibaculum tangerinum TaxID=3038772 RepID=A0ABY8L502_9FLAO|nr:bacteriocin fulvocin C-related protein [Tenacibaculum tangerinum]WGH75692.1 bacteriocin fulvocin C-related protein [Tenacibaculum tangerinum]